MYHVYDQDCIKRDASSLRRITLFMRGRHNDIYRMTLTFVLILGLMLYCTSGIRAMSIQKESDHTQLDELRHTVTDLSTKIEVLSETIRKGKIYLITNWCTTILLSLCCRGRDRMVSLFQLTSSCAFTAYQQFNTSSLLSISCHEVIYSIQQYIRKYVRSCLFVLIGHSRMILLNWCLKWRSTISKNLFQTW